MIFLILSKEASSLFFLNFTFKKFDNYFIFNQIFDGAITDTVALGELFNVFRTKRFNHPSYINA